MNECPYIVGSECDIAKCEEIHVSRKEKIELLDKVSDRIHKKMCSENWGERQCVDAMDRCVGYGYVTEVIAEMKAEVQK